MIKALHTGRRIQVGQRKAADVYPFLQAYVDKKQRKIADILQMVERYERKRMVEDRAYQAMSPLRRMLSGKKPDHHLAVEYIHYVKKPMEMVQKLRKEVESARAILDNSKPQDLIELPDEMEQELT